MCNELTKWNKPGCEQSQSPIPGVPAEAAIAVAVQIQQVVSRPSENQPINQSIKQTNERKQEETQQKEIHVTVTNWWPT